MSSLTTIHTFTYPAELVVLRIRLEAEGIECHVVDELTVQVYPFSSNAIGGIKLQVREDDVPRALAILKENGYAQEVDLRLVKGVSKIDKATSSLPLIKKLRLVYRLMIIATLFTLVLGGILYLASLPSNLERLTEKSWCLNRVTYKGEDFTPNTVDQIRLSGWNYCEERITFRTNGTITLPGFNSSTIWGQWKLVNDSVQISETDTFGFVYHGLYDIDFSRMRLTLTSEQTTLYCYPENLH